MLGRFKRQRLKGTFKLTFCDNYAFYMSRFLRILERID